MPENMQNRTWLTVKETAEALDVSAGTIRNWIRAGRIRANQLSPKLWRIPKTELAKFTDESEEINHERHATESENR